MEIGAFYTEGSNRIKVELYAEGSSDVVVNLLNSNVSDSKLSILDTDDTRTREQKLSKFIDRSIVVEKHNFNEGQATVYFNFLDFDVSSYMVEAISGSEEKLCNVNVIEVPTAEENPYIEDHNTDAQNLNNTELVEDVFDEMPGEPIVAIDFTNTKLVETGSAGVDYFGGGNRYLVDSNGILVKQVEECDSINSRYSPFQLNTTIKCENEVTNLFNSFEFDSSVIQHSQVQVQKGLNASAYKAVQKNKVILTTKVDLEGMCCFSVLLASSVKTKATLYINSTYKEIELKPEYDMYFISESCDKHANIKIEVEDYNARVFVLLPQIDTNNYPTSRVLPGKTREKDCITISCGDANIVFDPNGSDTTIGGFVNIEFVAGRTFSSDNCLIDWRNADDEGLVVYQDSSNSIIASFGEGYSVRSLPVVLEEGEHYNVKVQWDMDNLGIQVDDEEPVLISVPQIPMPKEYPADIKVGWSNEYDSLNSDIVKVQIGQ